MADDTLRTDLFIGGRWRPAQSGERFDVIDPGTEEVVASVANAGASDARAAASAAADAQPGWAAMAPRQRGEVLRRTWELLTERADDLARLITLENGKVLSEAKGEITYAAEFFRWFSEEAVRLTGELTTAPSGTNRIIVLHQPVGVAYLVTPWNFPAAMATRKIAPALAAGCAVVLKPATLTPLTALAVADILHEAGVPDGVVNVVPGRSASTLTAAVLEHPRVRKLSFTGSTEVGKKLIEQAADRVLNVSMELGGNAPFIVLADADLEAAVEGAMIAKMRHNGETCTAANRFYVEAPVAEAFATELAEAMGALPVGHGLTEGNRLGPLVDADTRDKVAELVDAAVAGGATALLGGQAPGGTGFYYPATVLTGVAPDNPIIAEEIFGPVAPIVAVTDADEAVRLANDTDMGLVAYLYTGDLAKGLRLAEALEAGMVGLNKGIVSDPAAPFGGVKESGVGREGGHEGMLDYTETKYIATDW
ncbi:MAG: NAD-dependent succinate-semialdehyde dehydrogenase [Acidimicrobiales bacterium]